MMTLCLPVHAKWFDNDWAYRIKLTIDSDQVNGDLSNFPVYVDLSDLNGTGFFTNVSNGGTDIRVTKSNGETLVAREIVELDKTLKTGELHFLANGTLSSTSNSDWYLYYGNPEAASVTAGSTYGANNVWDNNYLGVWHLNEDPSLDGARQFTRANSESFSITDGAQTGLDPGTSDFTIAGWIYIDSLASTGSLFGKGLAANDGYDMSLRTTGKLKVRMGSGTAPLELTNSTSTLVANRWYFLIFEFDRDANITIYIDNVADATTLDISSENAAVDNTQTFTLGNDGGDYHDGRMAKWAFWTRLLTASERSWLRNDGAGRFYSELGKVSTNGSNLKTNLISYWNLNETSGNALDSHGSNDLTDNNSVTATQGGSASSIAFDSTTNGNHGALNNVVFASAWKGDNANSTGEPRVPDSSSNGNHGLMSNMDILNARVTSSPHNSFNPRVSDVSANTNHGYAVSYLNNGNDARMSDVPAAYNGASMSFSGASQYIAVENDSSLNLTTNFSVAAWVKRTSNGTTDTIYDSGTQANHWSFGFLSSNFFALTEDGVASHSSTSQVTDNGWHHIAVVKSGDGASNISLYLDGSPAGTASAGTVTTPSGIKTIGIRSDINAGTTHQGLMDELQIYNDPLSASEVQYLASNGASGSDPGTANLAARWNFEESNLRNLGALNNGKSLSLDGTDDRILIPDTTNDLDPGAEMTIAGWFKTDNIGLAEQLLIEKDISQGVAEYWMRLETSNIRGYIRDGTNRASAPIQATGITANTWHHFAFSYSTAGNFLRLYLNGVLRNGTTLTADALAASTGPTYIGKRNTGGAPFDGQIDDLRVYKGIAKNDSQISDIYNGVDDTNGLVAHWKFDGDARRSLTNLDEGSSIDFDGDDDFVQIAASTSMNTWSNGLGLGVWAYPRQRTNGANQGFAVMAQRNGCGADFPFQVYSSESYTCSGAYAVTAQNGSTTHSLCGSFPLPLNEWSHVFVNYDGSELAVFINGVKDSFKTMYGNIKSASLPTNIGYDSCGGNYFNGLIDDVTLYRSSKSNGEILAIYQGTNDTNGIISHWKFDDNPNLVSGSTSKSRPGASNGSMTFSDLVSGKLGKAIDFDGTDDYISFGDDSEFDLTSNITISAWINGDVSANGGAVRRIVNKHESYLLQYDSSTDEFQSTLIYHDGSVFRGVSNPVNLVANTWYYLAGTYNGNQLKVYTNGDLANTRAIADSMSVTTNDLTIGARPGPSFPFDGKVDEVRISTIVRSATWTKTEFNNQNSPSTFYTVGPQESQGGLFHWHLF